MTDLLTLELMRLAWIDFDRRLDSLKQDHSAYVERIGRALLRVERRDRGGEQKPVPAPREEER